MEIESDSFTGPIVQGTCEKMCPSKELAMRERECLLYPFEMACNSVQRNKRPPADPERVVKEYSRPAAGRIESDPSDLRPAPVLKKTMNYLLHEIATMSKPAWSEIYAFVFDRSRAVRQDMVIQGIMGHDAIQILEQVVRFHAYAAYRLRHASPSEFDPVINKHHLLECLKRLLYLYQVTKGPHENRAEFEAVYLLDNLGAETAMTHFLELSVDLRKHPLLRTAYDITVCFCLRNYHRVLKLIRKLTNCLCLCVVSCHLYNLQVNFLQILSHGFSIKNCQFPVSTLTSLLYCASEKDTIDLCSECGLIDMFDQISADVIQFSKSKFCRPKKEKPITSVPVLESLLASSSLSEIFKVSSTTEPSAPLLPDCVKGNISSTTHCPGGTNFNMGCLERQLNRISLEEESYIKIDNQNKLSSDEERKNSCHRLREDAHAVYSIPQRSVGININRGVSNTGNICSKNGSSGNADQYPERGNQSMSGVASGSTPGRMGRGRGRGRGRGKD